MLLLPEVIPFITGNRDIQCGDYKERVKQIEGIVIEDGVSQDAARILSIEYARFFTDGWVVIEDNPTDKGDCWGMIVRMGFSGEPMEDLRLPLIIPFTVKMNDSLSTITESVNDPKIAFLEVALILVNKKSAEMSLKNHTTVQYPINVFLSRRRNTPIFRWGMEGVPVGIPQGGISRTKEPWTSVRGAPSKEKKSVKGCHW